MIKYVCEFVGTLLLVLIGNASCANATLKKSGQYNGGALMVNLCWGLAVLLPAFIFGETSGAIFNPALALALCIDGTLSWSVLPFYVIAEFLGAFVGQLIVYLLFKDHLDKEEDANVVFGCFATSPSISNPFRNLLSEIVGSFILAFAIKGISGISGITSELSNVYVFGIICAIGMSMGGLTGYAINPARDLGPRLAYTILPIKNKKSANWKYALIPTFGPIIGTILGVLVYMLIF